MSLLAKAATRRPVVQNMLFEDMKGRHMPRFELISCFCLIWLSIESAYTFGVYEIYFVLL